MRDTELGKWPAHQDLKAFRGILRTVMPLPFMVLLQPRRIGGLTPELMRRGVASASGLLSGPCAAQLTTSEPIYSLLCNHRAKFLPCH